MSKKETVKANSEKVKKEPLSPQKKKKIIIITVVSVLVLALIGTGIGLYVHFNKPETPSGVYTSPESRVYHYAIQEGDSSGFSIDTSWLNNIPLEKVSISCEDKVGLTLTSDFVLKNESAELGDSTTFNVIFDGATISKITVTVVKVDATISSLDEFIALSNEENTQGKVYIQTADIDLQGQTVSFKEFKGSYFGNNHKLNNFSYAINGGLFKETRSGEIVGVNLTNVVGNVEINTSRNCGVLVEKAQSTAILGCYVDGAIGITQNTTVPLTVYVGGIVGYATCQPRNYDYSVSAEIKDCYSNVKIDVSASGKNYAIGGVVGGSRNYSIVNTVYNGAINVGMANPDTMENIYVGGICGTLEKVYEFAQNVQYLDYGNILENKGNITILITGGADGKTLYVGGVFGALNNQSLINVYNSGKIDINAGRCNTFAGGIVGNAKNLTVMEMEMRGISVTNEINVSSSGAVYAGGVAGYTNGVEVLKVNNSITPTITGGDTSKTQTANSSVGRAE